LMAPTPSVEPVAVVSPGRPWQTDAASRDRVVGGIRPCHLRAIPNATPPVRHGQPPTLTVPRPAHALLQVRGNPNKKEGSRWSPLGPHGIRNRWFPAGMSGQYRRTRIAGHWVGGTRRDRAGGGWG